MRKFLWVLLAALSVSWGAELHCDPATYKDFAVARRQAVRDGRLIILFFYDQGAFSSEERSLILQLRTLQPFCSAFIFAELNLADPTSLALAQRLQIKIAPAISVSEATRENLHEVSRFEGRYFFEELKDHIASDVCEAQKAGEIPASRRLEAAVHCGSRGTTH